MSPSLSALRFTLAVTLIPVLAATPSAAWGVDGHHIINHLAIVNLPESVPAFLRTPTAIDTVTYYAPLPDHWRGAGEPELKVATAPEHFFQMETLDRILPTLPRNRYDFVRALAAAQAAHPDPLLTAEHIGLQPYQADEVWQRLKVAFRDYRQAVATPGPHPEAHAAEAEVLFLAGWLGHYVGDASQPLHTSIYSNGWSGPNPNGYDTGNTIHALFESSYVKANVKPEEIAPLVTAAPVLIDDVFTQYVAYLRQTHTHVEELYRLEKDGAFTGVGTPAGRRLVDQQLAAAVIELRDLIYTAWVRSADTTAASAADKLASQPAAQTN